MTGSGSTPPDLTLLMISSDLMVTNAFSEDAVMKRSTLKLRYPKMFSLKKNEFDIGLVIHREKQCHRLKSHDLLAYLTLPPLSRAFY